MLVRKRLKKLERPFVKRNDIWKINVWSICQDENKLNNENNVAINGDDSPDSSEVLNETNRASDV